MAFLDILNIPGLLGTELHTFKRANVYDKLDLGLAGVVALLAGVVLLLNGLVEKDQRIGSCGNYLS